MMTSKHEIGLREGIGTNPPGLLSQLRAAIERLLPQSTEAVGTWVRNKGPAGLVKAHAIKGRALSLLRKLEMETQRLIDQREALEKRDEMYRTRAECVQALNDSIMTLVNSRAEISVSVVKVMEQATLETIGEATGLDPRSDATDQNGGSRE